MKKKIYPSIVLIVILMILVSCADKQEESGESLENDMDNNIQSTYTVSSDFEITELENGLSSVSFEGDYGFDKFISQGGAPSDSEVVNFLKDNLIYGIDINFNENLFGCSTLSVISPNNEKIFGRNFDWNNCNAMVVVSKPLNGYESISTVNMDFIKSGTGLELNSLSDNIKTIASLYAPLDGMNEKGLCVAVNMIQDSDTIEQNNNKPDLTTTTAIRLLLDKAANVDEAVYLLEQYDMHSSMGMMIHFAVSDANGKSVVIEYANNEMVIIDSPAATNFYLAEGDKNGIGTAQSHERYNILMKTLSENNTMTMEQVKDALNSVSKDNFNEFESTEWSIVFNQTSGEVKYYHRENFDKSYTFNINRS